jgi:tetratricopeptide (TPR) repeat protein
MDEEDFRRFVNDVCSDITWKDLLKKWGGNIGALVPYAGQYFSANMSSFEHEVQLRAIKKLIDAHDDLKNLLEEQFTDFLNVVKKYERNVYPFEIFNISQIKKIEKELNFNPKFVKEYLPLKEIEELPLNENILLKGKIGIGKTRSIIRLLKRADAETIIVVRGNVRTLGVQRFENLDFRKKAILIWDDVQDNYKEFLKALPYLKKKTDLLIIAAIRSVDYEKIERDACIRERKLFVEVDLELYHREKLQQFVRLCEREFKKPLTDTLRKLLVEKAFHGDSTPLYVASIFAKETQITEMAIAKLPEKVVELWANYFRDLTPNEKCFMKALKAAKFGFSPPFKSLIEELYSKAFFGESRDLADIVASLKREHWIVEIPDYYVCLDAQIECFEFEEVDKKNFLNCLFEKDLTPEYHVQLLLGIGSHYYYAEKYSHLIKVMNRALEIDPKLAQAYYNRGNAYSDLNQLEKAIEDYDRALEIDPKLAQAYNNRGNAYSKLNQLEKAIEDYDRALEIDPEYAQAYNNRGTAYSDLNQLEKAIEDYDRALEIDPKLAQAYNNRGTAYSKLNQLEKAIEDYDRALELQENLPDRGARVYYFLGSALEKVKNFEKASHVFKTAGIIFFAQENLKSSLECFSRGFQLIEHVQNESVIYCGLFVYITLKDGQVKSVLQETEISSKPMNRIFRLALKKDEGENIRDEIKSFKETFGSTDLIILLLLLE